MAGPVPEESRRPKKRLAAAVSATTGVAALLVAIISYLYPKTPGGAADGVATPASPTVPLGWHTWVDPSAGYSVAVPSEYDATRVSTTQVIWRSVGGAFLRIDVTDQQKADPVKDWKEKAAARKATGCYAGYQEIGISSVTYFMSAADWEFTYVNEGRRDHVRIRGVITSPTRAFGIWWSAPESKWAERRAELDLILKHFVPGEKPLPSFQMFASYRAPCS